jgi:hypothetical protein
MILDIYYLIYFRCRLYASKEIGLEMKIQKSKHMLLSHYQNEDQNWDIKIAYRSFENVSQFKYLGTTVTNQNFT